MLAVCVPLLRRFNGIVQFQLRDAGTRRDLVKHKPGRAGLDGLERTATLAVGGVPHPALVSVIFFITNKQHTFISILYILVIFSVGFRI